MEANHALVYLEALEERGWLVQTPLFKAAFSSGFTFKTLKVVLADPKVTIQNLPPPPPSEEGDSIPVGLGPLPGPDITADIPEFSVQALHDYLVRFIVANDQVRATHHSV